jgi:hypothetical protein
MRPPADNIAPATALAEAVLINFLLDKSGMPASLSDREFRSGQLEDGPSGRDPMVNQELRVSPSPAS